MTPTGILGHKVNPIERVSDPPVFFRKMFYPLTTLKTYLLGLKLAFHIIC